MKRLVIVALAVLASVFWSTAPSQAWDGRHGGSRGHHHGFRGHHHGFRGHHGFVGARVFIGPGIFFGAPFVYPYTYPYAYRYTYPYAYPYPVYSPPAVVEAPPPVYAQPQPQYWYYCQDAQGYYPYVSQCPGGWLQVAPSPQPGGPSQGY
ncbi:MAG TPA: hypothetical protein VFO18_01245 [Methylomirabilota bacterium]|nr:hypothetical protein [Methylomirabilota bacterium]